MSEAESGRTGSSRSSPSAIADGIVRALLVAAVVIDALLHALSANRLAARLLRIPIEKLIGAPANSFVPASHFGAFAELVEARLAGRSRDEVMAQVLPARCGDGREGEVELAIGSESWAGLPAVVAAVQVVPRGATYATEPEFFQAIMDASHDAILAVGVDRRVLAINRTFFDLWRLDPGSVEVGGVSPALTDAQRSRIADPDGFETALR